MERNDINEIAKKNRKGDGAQKVKTGRNAEGKRKKNIYLWLVNVRYVRVKAKLTTKTEKAWNIYREQLE